MVQEIEVCVSNLERGSDVVWDHIQTHYPDIKLRRWGCLGYCERCIHNPFVLIDDSVFVEADNENLLLEKVERYIERKKRGQTD